jgi:hypothetical protein
MKDNWFSKGLIENIIQSMLINLNAQPEAILRCASIFNSHHLPLSDIVLDCQINQVFHAALVLTGSMWSHDSNMMAPIILRRRWSAI